MLAGRRSGLGGAGDQDRCHAGPLGVDRVVPPMAVGLAGWPLFFHIREFATGGYLAIATDQTAAPERSESEKSNQTAHNVPLNED